MTDTTQAIRDALLADVVATATAGIYAAVLAERERCAKVCAAAWGIDGSFTANEFAERIREGVKS